MKSLTAILPASTGVLLMLSALIASAENYYQRPDVVAYIDQLVTEHSFDRADLEQKFKKTVKQKQAIQAMDKPAEAKPWPEYKKIFITEARINEGIDFWSNHADLLARVEQTFGVPAALIVAIAGVETFYGRITGDFPVFSTLVTLGFDYPRRANFFRKELTEFLLLCRQEKMLECDNLKGSYAGAMGVGQFISSSYRNYAVDFNKDGVRDLWGSQADAMGSIANFLKRHGWVAQKPVGEFLTLKGGDYQSLLGKQFKPWLTVSDLKARGVGVENLAISAPFSLFKLATESGDPKVWAGYNNFFVITRYNHSHRYAMVIYQLSQLIEQRRSAN